MMRRTIFSFRVFALAAICAVAGAVGCHSPGPDNATNGSAAVSGDVAKNEVLARSETERAYRLLAEGNFTDAEPILNRAIAADSDYGPARNDLGLIYFQRNELYNAAWQFENAIKLMPGQPPPQNNLGLVLEESGKLPEAMKAYSRACDLAPENSEYAGNLARVRIRLGMRDDTTARLLQLIIERDPRPEWVEWARFNLARAPSPTAEAPPPRTPARVSDP